jgi:probable phosphoglycerate mutase
LQGHTDIPLNARGRAQAAALASALRDEGLTHVYCSDLGRAADTARAFAEPLGLPVVTDTALRERGFGQMEGLTYRELDEGRPEWARRWRSREPDFTPPDGESLITLHARVVAVAERLARQHAGGCIAVVSHGGVLDSLYRAATGLALDAPRSWQLGNAAINRLLYTGQRFTLVGWNDAQHLDGLTPA